MSKYLKVWLVATGTRPESNEVIHHIDVNPENNHINNLMLLARGDHMRLHMFLKWGCRVKDQICKVGGCNRKAAGEFLCMYHWTKHYENCIKLGRCKVWGCSNRGRSAGLCGSHCKAYFRDCIQTKVCKVGKCSNKVRVNGLCHGHGKRYRYTCIKRRGHKDYINFS